MGVSNGDGDGSGVDGDGSGGNSPSGRVPEQRLLSPESCFGVDGGVGTFRGFLIRCLGFSRYREYMGEEGEATEARGPHTTPRRGQTWARA